MRGFTRDDLVTAGWRHSFKAMQALEQGDVEGLALHAGLAVERLAKAALVSRNPAFLVDFANKDHAWRTLASLSGVQLASPSGRSNRIYTIGVEVGLKRLMDLGVGRGEFDGRDIEAFALARNSAVHGGGDETDTISLGGLFVRIVDALLADLGTPMIDHWGPYYEAAVRVKGGEEERILVELRQRIEEQIRFSGWGYDEIHEYALREVMDKAKLAIIGMPEHRVQECPACLNAGLVNGSYLQPTGGSATDSSGERDWLFLADEFRCAACGLVLRTRNTITDLGC